MDFLSIYLITGEVILLYMVIIWKVSLALKNSSIVDIFWGAGFVVSNLVYHFLTPDGAPSRKFLLLVIVTIWGLRLSFYILWRNWAKPEDFRYQVWRKEAGDAWRWRSLFKVFILQGLLMWIISTPLLPANYSGAQEGFTVLDILGLIIWLIGFFFESAGDLQLTKFKTDPANKGKVLNQGVWRYTRHPNYFGDAAQWWGYYIISLSAGGWWTIYSPILMTILLLRVSGVALLEKNLVQTKPQYQEYIRTTSAFFPLPPRKVKG